MIPGPIEFESDVLQAMATPTPSHVDPDFITTFSNCLNKYKQVCFAEKCQAFIVAGTGTFAMDMAAANLVEQGDQVLVISTGYFGLRYAEILKRYGAQVDVLESEIGDVVPLSKIEEHLSTKKYKLMTFTHVDTSTAVLNDAEAMGKLGQKYDVLTILDGVCSVAGEEIRQDEWGIDIVLTASQKAVGVPPGLALLTASTKAMEVFAQRDSLVSNYYADWNNWLPIMKAYEEKRPSYFGTPPVNLIIALEKSLDIILAEGLENRFERHKKNAQAFRIALKEMGLTMIPKRDEVSAHTLSAPYYPEGKDASMLKTIKENGAILAGGLLPELKSQYFRIGHMGSTDEETVEVTLEAIKAGLK